MKKRFLSGVAAGLAVLFSCAPASLAQFHNTGVFKAQVTLTAQMVVTGSSADIIVQKKLGTNDIINLALGRPLGTKVDTNKEVLALEAFFETHGATPLSQLIIYDTTQNGIAGIVVVVATLDKLDWQNAYEKTVNAGFGVASGTIKATTLGTPASNGFLDSPFWASGSGSGKHLFSVGDANASPKGGAVIGAHLKFVYTDGTGAHNFDGLVTAGTAKISGKPIAGW
jgi:hypothetical protein